MRKGIAVAIIHCAIVLSLAGKYAYDRQTLPREWVKCLPVDPNLFIRGRYVSLHLDRPGRPLLAYFIPEHAPDPSRLKPGQELWVEVTLPPKGDPRPIRLGIKQNGTLTPLP
jgi:hypothetical protein